MDEDIDIVGMVHTDDPGTSVESAAFIARRRTELHARVLTAFGVHGNMTDEELEQLPEFSGFGPSTIRKRRSELYQDRMLIDVATKVNSRGRSMLVWRRTTEEERRG